VEGRGERRAGRGEDRARWRLQKLFFPLPSVLDLGTRQSFYFLFFPSSFLGIFFYFAECPISGQSAKFLFFIDFLLLLS